MVYRAVQTHPRNNIWACAIQLPDWNHLWLVCGSRACAHHFLSRLFVGERKRGKLHQKCVVLGRPDPECCFSTPLSMRKLFDEHVGRHHVSRHIFLRFSALRFW